MKVILRCDAVENHTGGAGEDGQDEGRQIMFCVSDACVADCETAGDAVYQKTGCGPGEEGADCGGEIDERDDVHGKVVGSCGEDSSVGYTDGHHAAEHNGVEEGYPED